MRIFIDTDILIEAAQDADSDAMGFLSEIEKNTEVGMWVSAGSVLSVLSEVSGNGNNAGNKLVRFIRECCSIIPLRRATLARALNGGGSKFEDWIQGDAAQSLKMDRFVTNEANQYGQMDMPVVTPEILLAELREAITRKENREVPFLDLKAQHHQVYNEIDDKITDIIANNGFILGKHVEEFEGKFAGLQEAKYCIGVSSGTDALHIALLALGVGHVDFVIVPVNTFIATAEAVSLCGAIPIFIDCDKFYNIDAYALDKTLSSLTEAKALCPKAIIPVHLYGQPANMDEIMAISAKYDIPVVEDCCQAHLARWRGRRVGNFGAVGAFSFYPGKNLGAYGEAGALITNDADLYEKMKMIRQHGEVRRYHHQTVGHNYRMAAIQGAVLATKCDHIEDWTDKRQRNAGLYTERLSGIKGVELPAEADLAECVYHLYVIQTDCRDELKAHLEKNGISTGLHYPVPLHLQEAYKSLGYWEGDFVNAETAAKRILSLPMYPELNDGQIRYVCKKIKSFFSQDTPRPYAYG